MVNSSTGQALRLESRFRQMTWTPRQANFAHMAVWIARSPS
jgi:hypothetical protein